MEKMCISEFVSDFLNQIQNNPAKHMILSSGYHYEVYHAIATLVQAMSYYNNCVNIYNYCVGDSSKLLYDYL